MFDKQAENQPVLTNPSSNWIHLGLGESERFLDFDSPFLDFSSIPIPILFKLVDS